MINVKVHYSDVFLVHRFNNTEEVPVSITVQEGGAVLQ